MPKYWGKQIFSLESFLEVGQKQKTEKKREKQAGLSRATLEIQDRRAGWLAGSRRN